MSKIIIAVIIICFIYFLLLLPSIIKAYNKIKNAKNIEIYKYDNYKTLKSLPVYNKSALNFDNIKIEDRSYLISFINEINPDLPNVLRENNEIVDIKSYILNKHFYQKK